MIDWGSRVVAVRRQADLLDLSRSSVYYTARALSDRDLRLMRRLDELHLQIPFYGSRKLTRKRAAVTHGFEAAIELRYVTVAALRPVIFGA